MCVKVKTSVKCDNIENKLNCVYGLNRNKHAEFVNCRFQNLRYRAHDPKIETSYTSRRINKRDNIFKTCLLMLEEHKCLILTLVPKLRYCTHARKCKPLLQCLEPFKRYDIKTFF